ncbi:hypothetical protein N5079_14860 [Planotetraspora sp. A-T 1434]|nr:hypothetical protein [Planotetraspora sp. A-T 1434]MCT9931497.1 hypothetical protein [Planotetraspora sp. A-T 1434]
MVVEAARHEHRFDRPFYWAITSDRVAGEWSVSDIAVEGHAG